MISFDRIAIVLGYGVMIAGGMVLACALLGLALNYTWRKLQAAHGLAELIAAHRKYKAERGAAAQQAGEVKP